MFMATVREQFQGTFIRSLFDERKILLWQFHSQLITITNDFSFLLWPPENFFLSFSWMHLLCLISFRLVRKSEIQQSRSVIEIRFFNLIYGEYGGELDIDLIKKFLSSEC